MTASPSAPPATDWTTRTILGAVMASGLVVGTWSIYTLLRTEYGVPKEVALFGCVLFDLSALFFARLAQRAATSSDSGLAPRAAMLAMVGLSAAVNWKHAQMLEWGTTGAVILAAAPVVAELAYEMWHRHEHREALRRHGRVARALPVVGRWAWLMHPLRARRVIDAHVQAALTVTERAAAEYAATGDDAPRTTVERITDGPASSARITEAPHPQHVVITVRQDAAPAALPAADEAPHDAAPATDEAPHDAAPAALAPIVPLANPRPAAALTDPVALPALAGVPKATAVMRIAEAHPAASAPEIVRILADHGVTVSPGYVRTAKSRASRGAAGEGMYL